MSLRIYLLTVVSVGLLCLTSSAQEVPTAETTSPEHAVLKRFEGEWKVTSKTNESPDVPAQVVEGHISSKMLGELWVINEMSSKLGETTVRGVQTLGYDPKQKKYIGTWVDSMTNRMWHYQGTLDDSGKILTLEAEGPGIAGEGSKAMYRDVYEFKTEDHIIATSKVQGDDGEWITFMTGDCRKEK